MSRAARRRIRRSSVARTSTSPVSQPSERTITIVRRSSRWPHCRLNSASEAPIRVPPDHVLEGVEELEQEPAVEVHRARDVAEQHEPDLLLLPPTAPEIDDLPAREVRSECPPEVDKTTALGRPPAAARAAGEPAGDLDREPRDLVELLGREGREVLRRQRIAVGDGRHAERLARRVSLLVGHPGLERDPFAPLPRDRGHLDRRRLGATVVGRRDQPAQHGIVRARGPPEGVEAALEGLYLVDARDELYADSEQDALLVL